jgi:SAF domain
VATTSPKLTAPPPAPSTNGFGPQIPVLRRRRNVPGAVLGALVVVVCAFAVGAWASSLGQRTAVLVVARDVPAGAVITASDLTSAGVAAGHNVTAIPASDSAQVVGRVAAERLAAGTLVVRAELATGPLVPAGSAVVGLALKPGMFPAALEPGDRTTVVITPAESGGGPGSSGGSVLVSGAAVSQMGTSPDGQSTLVSVVVPSSDAPAVAAAGAQGSVSLVVDGGS